MVEHVDVLEVLVKLAALPPEQYADYLDRLSLSEQQLLELERCLALGEQSESVPGISVSLLRHLLTESLGRPVSPETGKAATGDEIPPTEKVKASHAGGSPKRAPGLHWHRGQQLGPYRLLERLGGGGFGEVWKAVHCGVEADQDLPERLKAIPVCLKLLYPGRMDLEHVLAEARAMAAIRHENVVSVKDAGRMEVGGREVCYIEMELAGELDERGDFRLGHPLSREGIRDGRPRFTPKQAARIMIGVSHGVHAAHLRLRVHRDLKPENILLEPRSLRPKVADFGIATWAGGGGIGPAGLGTPAYMPPEQARGEEASELSDVYSLGTVLYFLLVGEPPYQPEPGCPRSDGAHNILKQLHRGDPPRPLCTAGRRLPRTLERICRKAMSDDPSDRYGSALEMAKDLEAWLNLRPTSANPVGQLGRMLLWIRDPARIAQGAYAMFVIMLGSFVFHYCSLLFVTIDRLFGWSFFDPYGDAELRYREIAITTLVFGSAGGLGALMSWKALHEKPLALWIAAPIVVGHLMWTICVLLDVVPFNVGGLLTDISARRTVYLFFLLLALFLCGANVIALIAHHSRRR